METLFSEEVIAKKVEILAREVSQAYIGAEALHVVVVLKGAFVFASDLIRAMHQHRSAAIQVHFIVAKSYIGTESSGTVDIQSTLAGEIPANREVLIVEDIYDTGLTLKKLKEKLIQDIKPRSLACCVLLRKVGCSKFPALEAPEFIGFEVDPSHFVLGYGLDVDGFHREMPYIAIKNTADR